jgi:nucleolin
LTFESEQARDTAIGALDGYLYEGRRLVVSGLKPKVTQERPPNPPSSTIYVGNMSYDMTDRELNGLFRPLRGIKDVRVAIDRRTGQPRGFAHADFSDVESAVKAKEKLNGHLVNGRPLKLDFARSFNPRHQEPSSDVDTSDLPPLGGN